jgi:UPF0716 family protein affecting phage T7 exclusion
VGIGVAVAIVVLLATPGLAIAALIALLLLIACGISLLIQRRGWVVRAIRRRTRARSMARRSSGRARRR